MRQKNKVPRCYLSSFRAMIEAVVCKCSENSSFEMWRACSHVWGDLMSVSGTCQRLSCGSAATDWTDMAEADKVLQLVGGVGGIVR